MNRLLQRQLKKLGLPDGKLPNRESWERFLQLVDGAYTDADNSRYTLERSLNITSDEMQSLYEQQKSSYEARLLGILEAIPDIIFLLDEDGRYLEVMSGQNRDLFTEKEKLLGHCLHEVLPREQARRFLKVIKQALQTDALVTIEYAMDVLSGQKHFQGRAVPAHLEVDGKQTVVFVAVDITEIRQAQIQQRLLATVFDSGREGMAIMDENMNIVFVNQAYARFMRQDIEAIRNRRPAFLQDESILAAEKPLQEILREQRHWVGEISGYDDNDMTFPIWLTINTVTDDDDRISNYVAILTDVSEIKKSQQELEYVATHDFLTGLPNRVLFMDRLERALARSKRTGEMGALYFLDLNRFKLINDNLGHHMGDDLLRQVSRRLQKVCREADTLSRMGGDEFTVIVENLCDISEAALIAEKLTGVFREVFRLADYSLDVHASVGISVFPNDGTESADLIKFADTAMYSAKEEQASAYRFYTQELSNTAFEYFAMEMSLKKAIKNQEFFLLYQPQYDIHNGRMTGVEALIRWRHPELGVVMPSMFIPVAENARLIGSISDWVLEESCRQMQRWQAQGLNDFVVAVNISRKQLVDPDFAAQVGQKFADAGVQGWHFEFEITESAIMDKEYIAIENLNKLHAMGIRLAIDDFGTGYSSLANLKSFPLSRLKIDRSFVRDVNRDRDDEAIIRATIALGKSFGLKVIAEGVENEAQLVFLRNQGCDEVQGFFFSRPMPAEEIAGCLQVKTG